MILKIKRINIPKALREQIWIQNIGNLFESKCLIPWCINKINVFNYHVAHNTPLSLGGKNTLDNLKPICCRCNLSMSNKYTIDQWSNLVVKNNIDYLKNTMIINIFIKK